MPARSELRAAGASDVSSTLLHPLGHHGVEAGCDAASRAGLTLPAFLQGAARSIATHPSWADYPDAVLAVRTDAHPALALFGDCDDAASARFAALARAIDARLSRLRHYTYADAERAVERLAGRLADYLGNRLSEARFTPIPRGGHIVLGLLAQALDLPHEALGPVEADRPAVVVDDCALTGHRLGVTLARLPTASVVVAHLTSHPDLRAAVTAAEPRVEACLAAEDLGARPAHDPSALHGRWEQRTGAHRYWVGDTDPVSFAWKEPDTALWNPATEELEAGWALLPGALCWPNRRLGEPRIRLAVQPGGPGPLTAAPGVVAARVGDSVVVARQGDERALALSGSAGAMWEALLATGTAADAAGHVAARFDAPADRVAADLEGFVAQLRARGLVVDAPGEARTETDRAGGAHDRVATGER